MPWFCISMILSSNIGLSILLAWMKASPQSHLMSKTSYNNMTKMAQFRMPFSLSRQWYKVSPPFHIHIKTNQIEYVVLSIVHTNVWMTFFEIWIDSSYNNTTKINTTTMTQWPSLSLIYIFQNIHYIFPPTHCHHPVQFGPYLHMLVHPSHWFQ